MLKPIRYCLLCLMFVTLASAAHIPKNKLSNFKWIIGTWKMQAGDYYYVEEWKQANDSTLEGSGYKYPASDESQKTLLEKVQLISKRGEVFYVPTLVGGENKGQPVYFKFTGEKNDEYTFENKEHDFPQSIIYIPVSKNELHARVEGMNEGKPASLKFNYTRVKKL